MYWFVTGVCAGLFVQASIDKQAIWWVFLVMLCLLVGARLLYQQGRKHGASSN